MLYAKSGEKKRRLTSLLVVKGILTMGPYHYHRSLCGSHILKVRE